MDCIKATALYPWRKFWCLYQIYLDKTVLHVHRRWLVTATLASIFALRLFYHPGFYVVALCLSLYILNLFFLFLVPPVLDYGLPALPIKGSDELRPETRQLSEFGLWYATTKCCIVSIAMTFYSIFDVDLTILPLLLFIWLPLALGTVLAIIIQIWLDQHVPFTTRKQVYGGEESASADSSGGGSWA